MTITRAMDQAGVASYCVHCDHLQAALPPSQSAPLPLSSNLLTSKRPAAVDRRYRLPLQSPTRSPERKEAVGERRVERGVKTTLQTKSHELRVHNRLIKTSQFATLYKPRKLTKNTIVSSQKRREKS